MRLFRSLAAFSTMGIALASSSPYSVIYQFQGGQDGYYPGASMIADRAGNLYGTTVYGGGAGSCEGQSVQGCGTVFQLRPPATVGGPWTETVLYRFRGAADGAFPQSALVFDQQGSLYGTTTGGGSANCTGGCGTVFKLTPPAAPGGAWTKHAVYTFLGVPSGNGNGDPAQPNGLVFANGNIYGMAYGGGHCITGETGTTCYGAVYRLTPSAISGDAWSETVLYRFAGPTGGPSGPVFDTAGRLYGSAGWGRYGFGMIFRLERLFSPGDTPLFTGVYNFQGGSDGAFPNPGLTFDRTGNLYGTTFGGGPFNDGTVFQLTPPAQANGTWGESVLHGFVTSGGDALQPDGRLVFDSSGNLLGAAQYGGQNGDGALFELSPPSTAGNPWTESVLHSFSFGDGAVPAAGLTLAGSALYGTAVGGGSTSSGLCMVNGSDTSCGVAFQYVP